MYRQQDECTYSVDYRASRDIVQLGLLLLELNAEHDEVIEVTDLEVSGITGTIETYGAVFAVRELNVPCDTFDYVAPWVGSSSSDCTRYAFHDLSSREVVEGPFLLRDGNSWNALVWNEDESVRAVYPMTSPRVGVLLQDGGVTESPLELDHRYCWSAPERLDYDAVQGRISVDDNGQLTVRALDEECVR